MFWKHNLIALCWAIVVAVLILMPGQDVSGTGDLLAVDKIAHIVVYSVVTLLLIVGYTKQPAIGWLRKKAIFYAFISCLIYSTALELIQGSIPDRELDFMDIVANIAGIGSGVIFFYFIYKI